jgi:outer membrane lipoprotein-sorting protein
LGDIFQGLGDAEERFDIIISRVGEEGRCDLKLSPNPPWSGIQHLELTVSRADSTIERVEIHNTAGGITRFILGDLHVEDSFPEDFFRFDVPKGVDVIEEDG